MSVPGSQAARGGILFFLFLFSACLSFLPVDSVACKP
jgi:hypothetical protein